MWNVKNVLITAGISLGTTIVAATAKWGFGKGMDAVQARRAAKDDGKKDKK